MLHSVRIHSLHTIFFLTAVAAIQPTRAMARSVFLNGVDISNAQSQEVVGANVHINEKGDVFIIAPHYQVNEEDTYLPLSSAKSALNSGIPKHQRPQELNMKVDEEKSATSNSAQDVATLPKGKSQVPVADGDLVPASAETPVESGKSVTIDPPGSSVTEQPAAGVAKDEQKSSN